MDMMFNVFSTPGFGEIALVLAMVFISVLLLGLLIWSSWHWSIKASATIAAGLFFALTYFSIIEMQGWPTKDQLPEKFYLVWYYVDPPNKTIKKDGFIVVWTLEFKEKLGRKPRAYLIDYSLKMHKKLQQARKKMLKGEGRMIGENRKRKGKNPPPDSTDRELKFYNMPKAMPPSKQ